jgi:hypothetical protein
VQVQRLQLPVEHLGADPAHGLVEGREVRELAHRHLRHERPRRRLAPVAQFQAVEVPRRVPHRRAHLLQPLLLLHAQRRRVRLHAHKVSSTGLGFVRVRTGMGGESKRMCLAYLEELGASVEVALLRRLRVGAAAGEVLVLGEREAAEDDLAPPLHLLFQLRRRGEGAPGHHGGHLLLLVRDHGADELLVGPGAPGVVELVGAGLAHALRVELEAHDELALARVVRVRVVEPLDQAVRRERHRHEPLRQPPHALVVVAVHHQLLRTAVLALGEVVREPLVQRRAGKDAHRVAVPIVVVVVDVPDGGGRGTQLVLDVLVQRAAAGDVEHLRAAADAEVGDVALEAAACEAELDGVLLVVGGGVARVQAPHGLELLRRESAGGVVGGLVERRVDVLALAEEHAVDGLERVQQRVHAGHARHDHRHRAVAHDEVQVVLP